MKYNFTDDFWERIYLNVNRIDPNKLFGSILYLGMGTCYIPRLQSDNVIKTTIIEIDDDVIDYNKDIVENSWKVIKADVYYYEPKLLYDFIFIDIFYQKTEKDIMEALIDKYIPFLKENGKIFYLDSVCREVDKKKYKDFLIFV